MKKFLLTLIILTLTTSVQASDWFGGDDGEWKMGPYGPYWDEDDWPEWTPMHWMDEFFDDDDDDDYFGGGPFGYPGMMPGYGFGGPMMPGYGAPMMHGYGGYGPPMMPPGGGYGAPMMPPGGGYGAPPPYGAPMDPGMMPPPPAAPQGYDMPPPAPQSPEPPPRPAPIR